jgi:hypothetical protein
MSRLGRDRRLIRFTQLLLLVIAIMGPWVFDRIHVPAEYKCEAPFIRLEGDFCGLPMSWLALFTWLTDGFLITLERLISNSLAGQARELFGVLVVLLPVLPLITTSLMVWRKNTIRLQTIHLIAWGLGCLFPLFIVFSEWSGQLLRLWGVWLYVLLAAGALIAEITIRREQKLPLDRAL